MSIAAALASRRLLMKFVYCKGVGDVRSMEGEFGTSARDAEFSGVPSKRCLHCLSQTSGVIKLFLSPMFCNISRHGSIQGLHTL